MQLKDILELMVEKKASDIFLRAGSSLRGRVLQEVRLIDDHTFTAKDIDVIISEMLDDSKKEVLKHRKSYDLAISYKDRWRFRTAIFYQRNTLAAVIRKIDLHVPSFEDLNLPGDTLIRFCNERQGLILLAGITGSGKSTTIASMIDYINQNLGRHILTVEDPIEFTFEDHKSIINQREMGKDVYSYPDALKEFTLHSPDIIYIGNINDQKTCAAALTAAETGTLVFSTLHTVDASSTVERIVNFFPPDQHTLIFNQLATLLKGVLSLRLVPRIDVKGLIPAYEIMTLSATISSLMRENRLWEMPKYISSGEIHGMKSFNQCLFELVENKKITSDAALEYSNNKEDLALQLRKKDFI